FHTIHNDAPKEISNKFEFYLRRFFYSTSIVRAITISKDTSSSFLKFYKTTKFKEILNGRSFPKTTSKLEAVKAEIQQPDYTSFIHVGRFSNQKNQEVLVSVFNKIVAKGYKVKLFVIGPGFDSQTAKKLKEKAGDHIHFLGSKHNIADYYHAADAFCLSSVHEGMPITLIEAFACGCIPICTPAGGVKNMITDGKNGYLSNSFSEEDYCNKVKTFLKHKDKIDRNHLKELFYSTYHMNVCATNYINVYLENLSHGSEKIAIKSI
ncbi:MAG TPA: glycosyltransferase, partial [Draconibacterium sp.]|nr:glycosyltransferase [Draconibacterium sp.]